MGDLKKFSFIDKEGKEIKCYKWEAEGEAKGIIETGYEFGISEEEILARLQKKLNISLAEAQEYVKKFGRKNEEK